MRTASASSARPETLPPQERLAQRGCWSTGRASPWEFGHETATLLRPEDVARSEVFYNSTFCWV
jgi:hypothetical protein